MRNWISGKWAAFKAWTVRSASKAKAAAIAILAALGLTVGIIATADDVALSWTNAEQWSDGSALSVDDLDRTELWKHSFPLGTDLSTATREYELLDSVGPGNTSYIDADQPNGIHCYVAYHVAKNGQRSDASNESCKTVDTRRPGAPSGLSAQ